MNRPPADLLKAQLIELIEQTAIRLLAPTIIITPTVRSMVHELTRAGRSATDTASAIQAYRLALAEADEIPLDELQATADWYDRHVTNREPIPTTI